MRPLKLATLLAATDLRPESDVALETALLLARAAGATLHVVHVEDAAASHERGQASREPAATRVRDALRRAGIRDKAAKAHVVPGVPAESIRAVGDLIGADVIVVGPHRGERSTTTPRFGGTAAAIVAGATAPCLAVVSPLRLPLERVLVPVDLSAGARGALLVALSWASALRKGVAAPHGNTILTALHAAGARRDDQPPRTSVLEDELERLRRDAGSWAGVDIEGLTVVAWPSTPEAIAKFAADQGADLVVIGARGLPPDEATRLGSVSGAVVERSPVAVLLVPPTLWMAYAQRAEDSPVGYESARDQERRSDRPSA
jgi:nucleotide-binding universal stress UspA family protein